MQLVTTSRPHNSLLRHFRIICIFALSFNDVREFYRDFVRIAIQGM